MAKVKILTSCGGIHFSYGAGEIIEQNEWTDGLINGGLAEWVEPPTPPVPSGQPAETQKNDAPKKNK